LARRGRPLHEPLALEPGFDVEARLEQAMFDLAHVDACVDQALHVAADSAHAQRAFADHQRADQLATLHDQLSVRDLTRPAWEVDQFLATLAPLDLSEARKIQIEQPRGK